jgi:hypothetical protein
MPDSAQAQGDERCTAPISNQTKSLMETLKWLVSSSADSNNYSLMVKGTLSLSAAYLLQLLPILCGFHIVCISVDGNVLTSAVDTIANIVYLGLSLVGGVAFLWGLCRKIWFNRFSA